MTNRDRVTARSQRDVATGYQCVGKNVFCGLEPQHKGHDQSFSYHIWCANFYLRQAHTYPLCPGAVVPVRRAFRSVGSSSGVIQRHEETISQRGVSRLLI
jgi:hypothetical protein